MRVRTTTVTLILLGLGVAGMMRPPVLDAAPAGGVALEALRALLAEREVHEPQFLRTAEGRLLVVWREKGGEGSDLYATDAAGAGSAVRINDEAATVGSYPMDELRAATAAGPGSRLAVAWGDSRGQVRVAESLDGGSSWQPSLRLEQVAEPAYRSFPALAYDDAGTLHAIWIDSRFAEGFAEEPADLFYARVRGRKVEEHNLTADQEASVCGCCRPYLEATGTGRVRAVFRNTTTDGYRDIFTVEGGPSAGFSAPARVGPPLWKLEGCPMSGPTAAGSWVYFPDGSSGEKVLRAAAPGSAQQTVALDLEGPDVWRLRVPPRRVISDEDSLLLLVPGRPHGILAAARTAEPGLEVLFEGLPAWATSAYLDDGTLWLMGAVGGDFQLEARDASAAGPRRAPSPTTPTDGATGPR